MSGNLQRDVPPLPAGASVEPYPFNTDVHAMFDALEGVAGGEAWGISQTLGADGGYVLVYDGGSGVDDPDQEGADEAVVG